MREVQKLLLENQAEAARARFAMLVQAQPDKTEPAAEALVKMLLALYNQFQIAPVHAFLQDMELELPAVVTDRLRSEFAPRVARTEHYRTVLRGVTRERLTREARRAIVTQDIKWAAALGLQLLKRAAAGLDGEQGEAEAIQLLGRALGDLHNDQPRVVQMLQLMIKHGGPLSDLAGRVAPVVAALHQQGARALGGGGEQAWLLQLTEASLGLRPMLPTQNEVGEPAPEQVERFCEELAALLRAGLQGGLADEFIDALAVIFEYCPVDQSDVAQVAGVEERLFIQLGPKAKLVAVRTLGRLGELEPLRRAVLALANAPDGLRRMKLICGVVGGLNHADFLPLLKTALGRAETELEESWMVDALGRIANQPAADVLLERLGQVVRKIGERGSERRIRNLLTALGRIGRVGRARGLLAPEQRNAMVGATLKLVLPLERALAVKAVEELFSSRTEELDAVLQRQAAQLTVDVLWGQPLRQPTRGTVNGWREPMVRVLVTLGPGQLPAMLEAAQKHATQYSGAMAAFANAVAEFGDAAQPAVPLLETMTRVAMMQDDKAPRGQFQQEKVFDGATEQMKELDRDDVVHTLLYTLQNAGGEAGLAIVLDYADQVQAGRLASPGTNSTNLLADAKIKHGRLGELRTHQVTAAAASAIDEKTFKSALSDARGGLLVKKATRVAGLATLGQARRADALPVLLECLGDKDPLIVGAAQTAMGRYMHPLPGGQEYTAICEGLLGHPKLLKGQVLERLLDFLRREDPKNSPYDEIFERQAHYLIGDGALLHQLMATQKSPAMRAGAEAPAPEVGTGEATAGVESSPSVPPVGTRGALPMSELDKKREKMMAYKIARQQWLSGGRVGDPPVPPES
jgi:hypothetical protein